MAARRKEALDSLNVSLGGQHLVVPCDVAKTTDCERLIGESRGHFGRIDTLVCNAGYGPVRRVADTSAKEVSDIFATNVYGTIDCIRAAVPVMSTQQLREGWRGQLMIVSSAAARRGLPYFGIYSATKAAQLSIAEALRVELEKQKIAVTSVHPVGTKTRFFDVAEQTGGLKLPPEAKLHVSQTAERVAKCMARGIANPKAEVWPFVPVRLGLSIGSFFPSLVDMAMALARRKIERWNADKSR